jgi:outer membrane protein assembly factor BamC
LKASGETTSVQVLTREGGVDRSDTSRRILGLLHEQLK